jgi:hypothetical protein
MRQYLPSSTFTSVLISIATAAFLIYEAVTVTNPHQAQVTSASQSAATEDSQWQTTLNQLEAQEGSSLPVPPNQSTVSALKKDAQSSNLTDSVARSLLIDVTNAGAQGLGGDLPTQNQLANAALAQVQNSTLPQKTYTSNDIVVIPDSNDALKAYGNTMIRVMQKHPKADMGTTYQILGQQINGQGNHLLQLVPISKEYLALVRDLLLTPAPQSVAAYHLSIINGYEQMAESYPNMEAMASDPLRGLGGLQQYENAANSIASLFINIASVWDKDGILFSKDEPGASWASLLSGQ